MISPSIIGEIGNFTMVHPRTKPTQEAKVQHLCGTFMHWKQPKSQYLAHTINSHPPNLWPHRIPPKCPTQRPYSTHTTQTTMKLCKPSNQHLTMSTKSWSKQNRLKMAEKVSIHSSLARGQENYQSWQHLQPFWLPMDVLGISNSTVCHGISIWSPLGYHLPNMMNFIFAPHCPIVKQQPYHYQYQLWRFSEVNLDQSKGRYCSLESL